MKFGNGLISGRNQLQWVVLLLATAVVLPTVSLLWFMSRVVANERLAAKEKLAALYQDKLLDAAAKTETICTAKVNTLGKIRPAGNPYSIFTQLVLENDFQGMLVLDTTTGAIVYPASVNVVGGSMRPDNSLADARQFEFNNRKYAEAAVLYDKFTTDKDPHVAIAAIMGKSRCLSRLGRLDEAIENCQKACPEQSRGAAFVPIQKNADQALRLAVEDARLLFLSLLKQSDQPKKYFEISNRSVKELITDLYNPAGDRALLPANQNLFIAKKVLQILDDVSLSIDVAGIDRGRLEKLIAAEEFSISTAENSALVRALASKPTDTFFRAGAGFGLCHRAQSTMLLVLLSDKDIESVLAGYHDAFAGSDAAYRVTDASGDYVKGEANPKDKPFVVTNLPASLPNWKVELYFKGGEVFENAAKRQIAVYIWTGVLVIVLILAAGGFAAQVVSRQIRLNKMKSDFIATVSHELKTPLASMRVLVDTLLEGNIKNQEQSEEYLRMTAKENERLSRMIDSFLTFSRMERNKKVFTIVDTKPAAIAGDAAEAVKAKFAANKCRLTVDIADNLPDFQADHDAMVTVLINLLDNACKYTGDDKQIALKVFAENGNICFAVSDNGIGLARRHIRRIFDSFYQVDNSLARKAEGCGLGLSIVKFIVDAHKGTISVDSKPGKGSTFTVKIPLSGGITG